ncbi:uncharacterized protein LOC127239185 [Andrographis paniculata]|uniref:uncharacterized protein LOC127239185 n=1 Tax=Andrographis paniculata TaxID=175694 RepID=UPI0021E800BF|nr:uncharacterized protein LOC127239185 [Andrographis paniculata]
MNGNITEFLLRNFDGLRSREQSSATWIGFLGEEEVACFPEPRNSTSAGRTMGHWTVLVYLEYVGMDFGVWTELCSMSRTTSQGLGLYRHQPYNCLIRQPLLSTLQEASPTKAIRDLTPVEAWCGIKPKVQHLRVFSSVVYVHIPVATRTKLDDCEEKTIFVGYAHSGYKVLNPTTNKVIIIRDVIFMEDETWSWSLPQVTQSRPVELFEGASEGGIHSMVEETTQANTFNVRPTQANTFNERPRCQRQLPVTLRDYEVKANVEVERYKARFVAKGYEQRPGFDFQEVFAPVARMETIRLLIALVAQNFWNIHEMDVESEFLYGPLQEEIYVKQPSGFQSHGSEQNVYKLKKALYGLKQAPQA